MDLSKLLGDLYDTDENPSAPDSTSPEPSAGQPGPEWANEARLDEAFASWEPGPPSDAPAAEREMAVYQPTSFPQLEAALSSNAGLDASGPDDGHVNQPGAGDAGERMVAGPDPSTSDGTVLEPSTSEVSDEDADDALAGPPPMWSRADDDVLFQSRGRRRRRLLGLRRR